MNRVAMENPIGLDRVATPDEIHSAMSFLSPGALEFVGFGHDFSAMESDSNEPALNLREEIEWLMLVHKMRDCVGN